MNLALPDSFKCPICLEYSEDPLNWSCCETIFCKEFVKDMQACSMCRSKRVFNVSLLTKRLINSKETSCDDYGYKCARGDLISYPINECQMKVKRIEWFDHIGREHSAEMIK